MAPRTVAMEDVYQELLGLARHSFLSYVVESSSPVEVDEADRKMSKLFHEIYDKEHYYVERAYELIKASRVRPDPKSYSLVASNFNFLRPMSIAGHWATQVSNEVSRLEALKGKVGGEDPMANGFERLREDLLALRRESIRRVAELKKELTPPAPPPPPAPAAAAAPAAPAPAAPAPKPPA